MSGSPPENINRFAGIVGACARMRQLFSLIDKVADTDTTILIQGESGTGKELVARAIHQQGARRDNPFVPVNCGAIPAELLESELLVTRKGPSPMPFVPGLAALNLPTAERYFWMKSLK